MARVTYFLRQPSADDQTKPQPIYLKFDWKKRKTVQATGAKCAPKNWDAKKFRVRATTAEPNRDAINRRLDDLEAVVKKFYNEANAAGGFSSDGLKRHLLEVTGNAPQAEKVETSFLPFFRQFIERAADRTQPNGERISSRTVAKYKTTLSLLELFAKTKNRRLDFGDVNTDFHEDFTRWLQKRATRTGGGYSANAIGKHFQVIKTVLRFAEQKGLAVNQSFKTRAFTVTKEDSENIYLDKDELAHLFAFDLSKKPYLERVRDAFIVGCWTGLRYADLQKLNPGEHLDGNKFRIETEKTGERVVIPLAPEVRAVLAKYGGQMPPTITNQKFNLYIKEACKLAGLNATEHKGQTKGGQRISRRFEKWQLVSTHTARRSFATNAYLAGVPTQSIMALTGHRTESIFQKYIKVTKDEHADIFEGFFEREKVAPLRKVA